MNRQDCKYQEFFIDNIEIPHLTLNSFESKNNVFGPFDTPCDYLKVGELSLILYQIKKVKRFAKIIIFERTNIPFDNILNIEVKTTDSQSLFTRGNTKNLQIYYLKSTDKVYTLTIKNDTSGQIERLYSLIYGKIKSKKYFENLGKKKNEENALTKIQMRYIKGEITKEECDKLTKNNRV